MCCGVWARSFFMKEGMLASKDNAQMAESGMRLMIFRGGLSRMRMCVVSNTNQRTLFFLPCCVTRAVGSNVSSSLWNVPGPSSLRRNLST